MDGYKQLKAITNVHIIAAGFFVTTDGSTSGDIFRKGDVFQFIEKEGDWYKIKLNKPTLPQLELVDFGVSTATGDNIIRPGVVTTVQGRIQNRGQGPAEGTTFSINLPKGVLFSPDSRTNYTFSSLKPGEFKDLEFSFYPNKKVGKTIEVSIGFTEESTTGKFPLKLDVEKPQKPIQQLVV